MLGLGIPWLAILLLGLLAFGAIFGVVSGPRAKERSKIEELWKAEAQVSATAAANTQELSALREQVRLLKADTERTQSMEKELAVVKAAVVELRTKQP